MKGDEVFTLFDKLYIEAYKKEHGKEVEKIYKNNIYKEIYKNVSKYTKQDWQNLKERLNYIYEDMIVLIDRDPGSVSVQALVEELRKYYSDSFYKCDLIMFRALGRLYIEDKSFREKINHKKDGLAEFLSEAIEIYCDIHENRL